MNGVNEALKVLFDKNVVVLPSSGEEVNIKKVTLRTLQPITALLARAMEDLQLENSLPTVDMQNPAIILKLISKYFSECAKIVASLSSLTEDQFLDMDASDSVVVAQAVIALNQDFFTKSVLPNLHYLDDVSPQ